MAATPPGTPDPLARVPYHLGLATHDIGTAMDDLGHLFGMTWTPVAAPGEPGLCGATGPVDWSFRRVHSRGGPFHLELLEGSEDSVWATDRLAALHHVAYWSDDVAEEVDALEAAGWELEATFRDEDGRAREFAYLSHPEHIRVELVASHRREAYLALTAPTEGGS